VVSQHIAIPGFFCYKSEKNHKAKGRGTISNQSTDCWSEALQWVGGREERAMDLGLEGRVALITGGSKGIGYASALGLAREGVQVAICARGRDRLQQAVQDIAAQTGREILPVVADMNSQTDAERFVETARQHFGRVDILVNCAGSSPGGVLERLEEAHWMESLNLKFLGYVRSTKAVVPHMKTQHWGRIVNVIGNDGIKPIYFELTPGAANAAGINFTLAIAEELAPYGITVNAVNPGPVDTERWWGLVRTMAHGRQISAEAANALAVKSIPIGRLCTAEEVANVVVFLASERASFVTGASIAIDGAQRKALMDT
jgi:3-oxoacyl-[acyl-carrier protein] reductase